MRLASLLLFALVLAGAFALLRENDETLERRSAEASAHDSVFDAVPPVVPNESESVPARAVPSRVPSVDLTAAVAPSHRALRITFVDGIGASVGAVAFQLSEQSRAGSASTPWEAGGRADERGEAQLSVPLDRTLHLDVMRTSEHGDVHRVVGPYAPGEPIDLEVVVPTARDLVWFGRVEFDGRPVPGAKVTVFVHDAGVEPRAAAELESDAGGVVRVDAWSWRPAEARIRAEYGIALASIEAGHGSPGTAQRIPLWPSSRVVAEVVDESGRALSGVTVELSTASDPLTPRGSRRLTSRMVWSAVSGRDAGAGRAEIDDVAAEVLLDVRLHRDGDDLLRGERVLTLAAGAIHEERFVVGDAGLVDVRVLDASGAPIEDAEVLVVPNAWDEDVPRLFAAPDRDRAQASAPTDADGRARFTGLPLGNWYVGLGANEDDRVSLAQPVRLTADEPWSALALNLERSLALGGTVVDEEGNGIGGIGVTAVGNAFAARVSVTTDAEGAFRLAPLPAGRYWVQLTARDVPWVLPWLLEFDAGREDLLITLPRGGAIDGRVLVGVGPSGGPAVDLDAGVQVRAYAPASDRPYVVRATSFGYEERFTLAGLDTGNYTLLATSEDGAIGVRAGVRVARPNLSTGIDVELRRGVPLRFRYEGDAEQCTLLVTLDGAPLAYVALPRGVTETVLSPEGRIDVELQLEGEEDARTMRYDVVPGEPLDVVLR